MTQIKLEMLFKKIQKDDKKEVLEFHVQGDELPFSQELVNMAGGIAVLEVEGSEIGEFQAEFKSIQRDSKKTKLLFNIKGKSEAIKLYKYAGSTVNLFIEPSQMTIEEFEEMDPHEGIEYQVEPGGTVAVEGQMSVEDIPTGEPSEVNFDDEDLQEGGAFVDQEKGETPEDELLDD